MRFEETLGISYLVNLIEHELRQKIDRELGALSITLAQYTVLSSLEMGGTLTNADLARRCSVTPQTVNRMITQLKSTGLVQKLKTPGRGLKVDYSLTKKGVKAVCDAHISVHAVEKQFVQGLSKAEFKVLQSLLKTCALNLKISNIEMDFA